MHLHHRCGDMIAAASLLLTALLAIASPATAQQPPSLSATPTGPYGMSMAEWQGVSCLWGGSLGALGVFYYSDVLAVAATGVTNPLLLVPLVATGFLGGCSVGANGAPGLIWLLRQ
jgi:hypothetical protein